MKLINKLVTFSLATVFLASCNENKTPPASETNPNNLNIRVNQQAGVVTQEIDTYYTIMADFKDSIFVKSIGYNAGYDNNNKEIQIPFKAIKDSAEKAKINELAQFLKTPTASK